METLQLKHFQAGRSLCLYLYLVETLEKRSLEKLQFKTERYRKSANKLDVASIKQLMAKRFVQWYYKYQNCELCETILY